MEGFATGWGGGGGVVAGLGRRATDILYAYHERYAATAFEGLVAGFSSRTTEIIREIIRLYVLCIYVCIR